MSLQYVCSNCGASFPRWAGKCPDCDSWNSLKEAEIAKEKKGRVLHVRNVNGPVPLESIAPQQEEAVPTQLIELDRVLGKGFVPGSVCLLGGEPGIGKSTLSLQIAQQLAKSGRTVLYVSGEESASQLRLRSERLGENPPSLLVLAEMNLTRIIKAIDDVQPEFFVLDSLQVVYHPDLPSVPGSVNQVRQCAHDIITVMKDRGQIGLLVGHITKDGSLAGPKVLEHLVDVILYFEGDRNQQYRLLRSFKNRYSNTNEIGIFEMTATGLLGVANPSKLFIDEATLSNPGCVVSAFAEGSRIFLVEIQALVVPSGFGMAKRTFLGVDPHRANLLIAAMEKIMGLKLSAQDIILNVVGGMKVAEPGLDLAVVLAMVSSQRNLPLQHRIGVIGEVGLTGEIRPVAHCENRVREFEKMGFSACILPEKNRPGLRTDGKMTLHFVKHIREAIQVFNKYVETVYA